MTTIYDELEEAWKREFHSSEVQPLKQGFFKELASYVKRLRDAQRNLDAKSSKAMIMDDEMQRLEQLSNQLMDRRLEKLRSHHDPSSQLARLEPVEKQAYQELSDILSKHKKLKEDLFQGREPSSPYIADRGLVMIRFVRDVPAIIGVDLKTHGPFLKEDIARVPHENAESLIRQGSAVEINPRT